MRLLFDQNLSRQLVDRINDLFPESLHVVTAELETADDSAIWEFARTENYAIVTKDSDFHQRSLLHGAPPKVIWVQIGNCSTKTIEELIRKSYEQLLVFSADDSASFFLLR